MTNEVIVDARSLVKRFGQFTAVDQVNFSVQRGDIYGFLGPNGSGKSTTIRMMLGLIRQNEGEIRLFGEPVSRSNYGILSKVGALIERPDFYNYLSAYKNLELLARYSGLKLNEKQIIEKLDWVGLADRAHSKVRTFSQGMKQRLGIAQTLLHNPELIILDEPVNGLDPQGIKDMRNLIVQLNRDQGKTLIVSSHILREMELISNRMLVINKGKVVVEGEVKKLLFSSTVKLVLMTNQTEKTINLLRVQFPDKDITTNILNEIHFEAQAEQVPEINEMLVNEGIKVRQLQPLNSLEDYFLHITE
jgi:ABC-2 type transport system ATP-binding protein